jgi:hypothetical protein
MSGSPLAVCAVLGAGLAFAACSSDTGLQGHPGYAPHGAGKAGGAAEGATAGSANASGGKGTGGSAPTAGTGTSGAGSAERGGASGSGGAPATAGTTSGGRAGSAGTTSVAGRGGTSTGVGGEAGERNGAGGEAGHPSGGTEEIPAGYVKAILGVGYGGIRILSRDGGNTWTERAYAAPSGGDDEDLLRAVTYGKGRWIATGWKLMSSDDGVHWTDHGMLKDGILAHNPIVEGLAYKDGYFYAAGDGGSGAYIYRSSDGLTWSDFGRGGDTVKHTGLTYHAGIFVSYGDSETSYQSTDGKSWTEMGIDNATFCEGKWQTLSACHDAWWFDDGFYIYPEWGGQIRRSTTGSNFKTVYTDDQENTLYRARAIAEGYVAPE